MRSRVATRVVALFILCALVPLAGLMVITTRRTSRYLEREAATRLRYDAKTVMMDALGRLDLSVQTLRLIGTTLAAETADAAEIEHRLDDLFPRRPDLLIYAPDHAAAVSFGAITAAPALTNDQRRRLDDGLPLIVRMAPEERRARVDVLVVPVVGARGRALMMATIDPTWIFGLEDPDPLPPDSQICVHRAGELLVCSSEVSPALADAAGHIQADLDTTLTSDADERLVVRSRLVPLQVGYGAEPWTVVMMRPRSLIEQPAREFLRDFWWISLGSLLVVSVLALSQVRRQMQPLQALMEATRRLALRRFATPVVISSGDEFEELGKAFNQLSGDLKRQFDELEAFGLGTLEALARAIDAKSPWTAGHSSRVTDLAVALAKEMGLPEDEIELLRRGGLVHDIGKLATPAEILDKPGRLTAEEEAIIRRHPQQGVYILEPIGGFEPLLPIVAQHHERWDGSGYPHGLAGNEIARTARVLAVADVFDAMRSERPYRSGMSLADTLAMIHAGAGSHFDPAAAVSMIRMMTRDTGCTSPPAERAA